MSKDREEVGRGKSEHSTLGLAILDTDDLTVAKNRDPQSASLSLSLSSGAGNRQRTSI